VAEASRIDRTGPSEGQIDERDANSARASAVSVRLSHDDASVMILSAERALLDLRDGLVCPPPPIAPISADRATRRVTTAQPFRRLGFAAIAATVAVASGLLAWPSGQGAVGLAVPAPIIDAATASSPAELGVSLARRTSTDSISNVYAAEFARSDAASVRCLAEAVYYEARGEQYIGQVAVAQVVLNRARSGKWPRSICAVINQGVERGEKCQFSYACRTTRQAPHGPMWERAQEIAIDAVRGRVWLRELIEATHYHTKDVAPVWRQGLDPLGTFGAHNFYRTPELGCVLAATTLRCPGRRELATETDIADVDTALDIKVPPPITSAAVPKPRQPILRQVRAAAEAPTAPSANPAVDWARELQSR
jgi:hypothetical protein